MAFNLPALKQEADTVVSEATNIVDLVRKYADFAAKFGGAIPGAGPEVELVVKAIDDVDKALHVLQNALNAV